MSASVEGTKHRRGVSWAAAVALVLVVGVVAAWVGLASREVPPDPSFTLSVLPPEGTTFGQGFELSPDGTRLAFVATDANGQSRIWVRPLDSLASREPRGTEDAFNIFWSAGGENIGFFAAGYLKRMAASGGVVETLASASRRPVARRHRSRTSTSRPAQSLPPSFLAGRSPLHLHVSRNAARGERYLSGLAGRNRG